MPLPANFLGIFYALASAAVWGAGDFSGGYAARKHHPFQVMALAAISGIVVLLLFMGIAGERLPDLPSVLWAASAGVAGAVGIATLYRGLATGNSASVAPTAAVVGAIVPVGFGLIVEGYPGPARLAGFILAFLGIWLVSQSPDAGKSGWRNGFLLACLAGIGFGGFFTLIAQVAPGTIFAPLVIARLMTLVTALVMIRFNHLECPVIRGSPIALLAGVLDAAGNIFYLLAKQTTRLDITVVLVSLYPAGTVLLSRWILKESISLRQWIGIGACVTSIALITI